MPSLHRVGNHLKYVRSNFVIVASSFILMLASMLVVGSLARAGENALAYYGNDSAYYENGGYPVNDGYENGGYPVNDNYGYADNGNNGCHTGCQTAQTTYRPSPTPCPWWNNSYNCRHVAYKTPCPWWNNSYSCSQKHQGGYYNNEGSRPTYTSAGQQSCACDNGNYDNDYYENGGYPVDDNGDEGYPPQPTPTETPVPEPTETPAPVNNNNNVNNNNSSATANVVVTGYKAQPASTATRSVKSVPSASAGPVMELPETGPADGLLSIAGAGGLVAAGTAYIASRRELLRTVFKR